VVTNSHDAVPKDETFETLGSQTDSDAIRFRQGRCRVGTASTGRFNRSSDPNGLEFPTMPAATE